MNKVILMGRLTRDPEVRYSQGSTPTAIAKYTLAVDRRFSRNSQDGQTADFISCTAFGKSAEFCEKYCHKGTKLIVTGRIQTGSYTNKDGQKVYTTDVIAEDQEFAESKSAQGGSYVPADNGGAHAQEHASSERNAGGDQPAPAGDGFMNIPDGIDEELPFS
ncbi:MAG: single-stranded DNA-binding protein [Lachnospiraceae bacterium]|jgi:single-strand DNA-binding protein|nr:single-stranded DNA-binding protein [Lachnospiraceae bacterium]